MLKSYVTAALRHFNRNKLHTSINILGLGLGIMVTLLALAFMLDEKSFDKFHANADRLYRLNKTRTDDLGNIGYNAESSGLYGPGMVDEFPEVEDYVRYQTESKVVFSYKDNHVEVTEDGTLFVDNSFFTVFDFHLLSGNKNNVLTRPATIVLTPALAGSLFGSEDPIGKTVIGVDDQAFEVTGVAEEAPRNSHIQFKALISYSSTTPNLGPLNYDWMNNWHTQGITTYILLKPGSNSEAVREKLVAFTNQHIPKRATDYHFYLQPFSDIYLNANKIMFHRMSKTGNEQYVYFFGLIAAFVLFIACVNYVNISTSKSTKRSREVGLRKSLGARKEQLVKQFLGESWLTTVLASLLGLLLLYFAVPLFNNLTGKSLQYELLWSREIVAASIVLVTLVSLVAGGYPAFVMSAFQPAEVLKSAVKSRAAGNLSRHVLITFQLIISLTMISATVIVYRQMNHVMTKDLGFDKDHVLVMNLTNEMVPKGKVIREEVSRHASVVATSLSRMALGGGSYTDFIQPEGFPPDQVETRMFPVDFKFKETYGMNMSTGRFFDEAMASDSNAVIINEALVNQLQWEDPLQKTIQFSGENTRYHVVGVIADFNYQALYREVEPLVMYISGRNPWNLSIKFTGDPTSLISYLESVWKKFESRIPFQFYFLDDAFAKAYEADNKLLQTVIWFASLSIVIACLGLYGLVSFTIEQRTKEFGIRKVMGASVGGLNFMVNKKFILMVVIAAILAIPLVALASDKWLKTFAYRIEPGPGEFLLAAGITMTVTLLAVSIQAIRAASINPAKALRYE